MKWFSLDFIKDLCMWEYWSLAVRVYCIIQEYTDISAGISKHGVSKHGVVRADFL